MFEYIHVLFALLAGIIFTIIMYLLGVSLEQWLLNVIIIMVVMLILGYILKIYLKTRVFLDNKNIDGEDSNNDENIEDFDGTDKAPQTNENSINFDDFDD